MKKPDKIGFGTRTFVPYDEHTDLSVILVLDDNREIHFHIMVHKSSDDPNGVILWFDAMEK